MKSPPQLGSENHCHALASFAKAIAKAVAKVLAEGLGQYPPALIGSNNGKTLVFLCFPQQNQSDSLTIIEKHAFFRFSEI